MTAPASAAVAPCPIPTHSITAAYQHHDSNSDALDHLLVLLVVQELDQEVDLLVEQNVVSALDARVQIINVTEINRNQLFFLLIHFNIIIIRFNESAFINYPGLLRPFLHPLRYSPLIFCRNKESWSSRSKAKKSTTKVRLHPYLETYEWFEEVLYVTQDDTDPDELNVASQLDLNPLIKEYDEEDCYDYVISVYEYDEPLKEDKDGTIPWVNEDLKVEVLGEEEFIPIEEELAARKMGA